MPPEPNSSAPPEKLLLRWVEYGSALCIGALGGFLCALRQVNPKLRFELDAVTVVGGLACFAGTLAAWRWLGKGVAAPASESGRSKRRAMWVALASALALTVSFLYSLKDVSASRREDFLIGTCCAVAVLALVGVLIWKVGKFLEGPSQD